VTTPRPNRQGCANNFRLCRGRLAALGQIQLTIMKFWIRIRYPASSCAGATRSFRQNRTPAGYAGRAQIAARIELTAAGTAEPRQITVRIGYALAMAPATGAPVRVAGPLMDQLAVRAKDDLVGQVTGDVPLPR
jgi:hypothetical protein